MTATFTDAERTFADSATGRRTIAHARMVHDGAAGHPCNGGAAFTDEMAASAVRRALDEQTASVAQSATYDARAGVAGHLRDAAHAHMVQRECGKSA